MGLFSRFNLPARENAMRGIALHSLILFLYAQAEDLSDGLGIGVGNACRSLHEENARSISLVSDGIEAVAAINRSRNVTDCFIQQIETECKCHPTVHELRTYLLRIEPRVRNTLQSDFLQGYLPHLTKQQWLEYWSTTDAVLIRGAVLPCATPAPTRHESSAATDKDADHPISREATPPVASRKCPNCFNTFSRPLQAGSDFHCPHCMHKIAASDVDAGCVEVSSTIGGTPSFAPQTKEEERLRAWLGEPSHPVRGNGQCDYPGCRISPYKVLGANHYCMDHVPRCLVKGCSNRGLAIIDGFRLCRSHSEAYKGKRLDLQNQYSTTPQAQSPPETNSISKPPNQPSVTANNRVASNTPQITVPKQRCKICEMDFAVGYISPENICKCCALEQNTIKDAPAPASPSQPSVTAPAKVVGKAAYTPVPIQRCKICDMDYVAGYISPENICKYCAAKLAPPVSPSVSPSPPPPVANLRWESLRHQLAQLGCTFDGSMVTLPDKTSRYIASTFDLEDIRDELMDPEPK